MIRPENGGHFPVLTVKVFDVAEAVGAHLVFVGEDVIVHGGGFVAIEEGFHRGIVEAATFGGSYAGAFSTSPEAMIAI